MRDSMDAEDIDSFEMPLLNVRSEPGKPLVMDLLLQGKPLTMELDTGAVSLVSEETNQGLFS